MNSSSLSCIRFLADFGLAPACIWRSSTTVSAERLSDSRLFGRSVLLFQLRHPNVAGYLPQVEDQFVTAKRDFQEPNARVHQAPPRPVGMIYVDGLSYRTLRCRIQALGADTAEAVPVGGEVDEVAIGRPPGLVEKGRIVCNRDPLLLPRRQITLKWYDHYAVDVWRVECPKTDPAAIRRKASPRFDC